MEISIIPKWLIRYVYSDTRLQYEVNILISNILIITVFLIFGSMLLGIIDKLPHFCLFEKITNIQCPVCGITRAFSELSKGNIVQAYNLNLSSLFVAFFFVLQIPLRICSLSIPQSQKTVTKISKTFNWLILIAIAVNWVINLIIRYL